MKLVKLANFKAAKTHENREVGQLGQVFSMVLWGLEYSTALGDKRRWFGWNLALAKSGRK